MGVTRALTLHRGVLLAAMFLPVCATAAALLAAAGGATWLSMPAAMRVAFSQDAILYIAGAALLGAPIAGVSVTRHLHQRRMPPVPTSLHALWILGTTAALYVAVSAVLMLTIFGLGKTAGAERDLLATSHATLFAVGFALTGLGALSAVLFPDQLDAMAFSVLLVIVLTGALLVTGTVFADMPRGVINAAVVSSPLLTIASAAHIDVARMTVPYQMSPLAHVQVHYLAWYSASALYSVFGLLCFVIVSRTSRSWLMPVEAERIVS
jgi:hypothetical protein